MYKNRCYMPFILYPPDMYDIGTQEEADALDKTLSLDVDGENFVMYLSIPYCRVRCKACPYFVDLLTNKNGASSDILDIYVNFLVNDMKRHAAVDRWRNAKLRGVYIGGGTGSLLKINHLDQILDALGTNFQIADGCEITLEGNAEDYSKEKIHFLARSMVNRISLGAQSFQPEILRVVGSPHKAQETQDVIRMFQNAGLDHIQLDMMYNIPGHTLDLWEKDLEVLSMLGIKHLTTYLYRITPGSQQEKLINSGKVKGVAAPDSQMVMQMQSMIRKFAENTGMINYMHEHYAVPGYESKYNYWTMNQCVDALGIGPGAYSFINQRRTGTSKSVDGYIEAVSKGKSAFTTAGVPLSPLMSRQRYVIFNLLYFRIDKAHYRNMWGTEIYDDFMLILDRLFDDRLMEDCADTLCLTERGKTWLQNVMLEFFDESMWENSEALRQQQSSWAMNNHMIGIGAAKKSFWLERIEHA
jgi:oxygen-independent coproporphyrinogen-3 oxidase